jgi:hypothetical protein
MDESEHLPHKLVAVRRGQRRDAIRVQRHSRDIRSTSHRPGQCRSVSLVVLMTTTVPLGTLALAMGFDLDSSLLALGSVTAGDPLVDNTTEVFAGLNIALDGYLENAPL